MRKIIYFIILSTILIPVYSFAAIHRVPGDYTTVQQAIDSSTNGDTIELAVGTYTGSNNRDIDFKGKEIVVRSSDPNDHQIVAKTIIDCQGSGRGFVFNNKEKAASLLEGITIINGKEQKGSGILIDQSSPTIAKCIIRDCGDETPAYQSGGGIGIFSGSPLITDCKIINNVIYFTGGGIYSENGNPSVINCTIENNRVILGDGAGIFHSGPGELKVINCDFNDNSTNTRGNGGGICVVSGQPTIKLCSFTNNKGGRGGGLFFSDCNSLITECAIKDNYATSSGGLYFAGRGTSNGYNRIEHCQIIGNSANSKAGGISSIQCNLYISNCIISGNTMLYGGAGGAVSIGGQVKAEINQCTIVGNKVGPNPEPGGWCLGGALVLQMCDVKVSNSIIRDNRALDGPQIVILQPPLENPTKVILHHNNLEKRANKYVNIVNEIQSLTLDIADNLDIDPCFAKNGLWVNQNDSNAIAEPNDVNALWIEGDYHLKSRNGRWDNNTQSWIKDEITSPCIDAGDPASEFTEELPPNGKRVNMGAYGGTAKASKSSSEIN